MFSDDDAAEDVFGGLEKAIGLSWASSAELGHTKVIYHICDAPCHGSEFHSMGKRRDHYPDGDPKGRKVEDLFGQMRAKSISYYFGRITNETDKMLEKFAAAYGRPITSFEVSDTSSIVDSIVNASSLAVTASGGEVEGPVAKRTRMHVRNLLPSSQDCPLDFFHYITDVPSLLYSFTIFPQYGPFVNRQ